jgi:hypothetical protein
MTVRGVGLVESTTTEDEMLSQAKIPARPAKPKRAASRQMWRAMHWNKRWFGEFGALKREPVKFVHRQWTINDYGHIHPDEHRLRKRTRWQGREAARRVARVVRGAV